MPPSSERMRSPEVQIQKRYQALMETAATPENIHHYFDTALETLIAITHDAVTVCEKKEGVFANARNDMEREDTALRSCGVPDVQETLGVVNAQLSFINDLQAHIQEEAQISPTVFVPPSSEEKYQIKEGSGIGIGEKALIPRLLTLLYILEHDLELSREDSRVTKGTVTGTMMREHPYFRVAIEVLNRVVYICEEEGNASYVFDTTKLPLTLSELDRYTKDSFNTLIHDIPEVGRRLVQCPTWRERMVTLLNEEISEKETKTATKRRSDLTPKVEVSMKKAGWESASSLGEIGVRATRETIKTFAEQFRESHPEWFEVQKNNRSSTEHYHPDLVLKIREHFNSIPEKKDGWESASSLYLTVGVMADPNTIKKFTKQFRETNPEWFEMQKPRTGSPVEHYHPELVLKIREHFGLKSEDLTPKKRDGWESVSWLRNVIGVSGGKNSIKTFAEQFRESHPEWFEVQKNNTSTTEHYHPELVFKIREHFNSIPEKKDGWESASSLYLTVGVKGGYRTIQKFADNFKETNPEWFEMQKPRTGSPVEHYHPELVKKIIEKFGKQ